MVPAFSKSDGADSISDNPLGKARRWMFIRACLIAVLVGFIVSSFALPYGYLPTGNRTLDRFAGVLLPMLRRQEAYYARENVARWLDQRNWPYPQSWWSGADDMDFKVVKDWESDLGKDPDYWELRYLLGVDPSEVRCQKAIELTKTGIYSRGMLWRLIPRSAYACSDETCFDLMRLALEKDPDNGALYLANSYINVAFGEVDAAQDDLLKAAAAPDFRFAESGFDRYWQYPGLRALFPGNQAVYGYLMQESHGLDVWLKEEEKNLEVCLVLGYSPQVMDDLAAACVRHAHTPRPNYQELITAAIVCRTMLDSVPDKALTLDAVQTRALENLRSHFDAGLTAAGITLGWRPDEMVRTYQDGDRLKTLYPVATNIHGEDWQTSDMGTYFWHPSRTAYAKRFRDERIYRKACKPIRSALLEMQPLPFNAWAEGRSRFDELADN